MYQPDHMNLGQMYCEGFLSRVLSTCYQAILPLVFLISMISINCLLLLELVIDFVYPGQ